MSCCGNNGNYYSRSFSNNGGCCQEERSCCANKNYAVESNYYKNSCNGLNGLSCPFNNNNDCECYETLRRALCNLTNQRVIIHVDGCKMCVVIVSIGKCFIKAINPCTQKVVYFNIRRIDNVEDVLPRCY